MRTFRYFLYAYLAITASTLYVGLTLGFGQEADRGGQLFGLDGFYLPGYHYFDSLPDVGMWLTLSGIFIVGMLQTPRFRAALVLMFLSRGAPEAAPLESVEDLRAQGYTAAQIKREQRAQRYEQRSQKFLRNSNLRVSRFFSKR